MNVSIDIERGDLLLTVEVSAAWDDGGAFGCAYLGDGSVYDIESVTVTRAIDEDGREVAYDELVVLTDREERAALDSMNEARERGLEAA